MFYICPICEKDPTSHSFKHVGVFNDTNYFYTCVAKASRYKDRVGILNHYRGVLNDYSGQPWIWIFDGAGFEAKHAMDMQIAIDLAKLISTYSETLLKIKITNPTWHINGILKIITPFLSKKAREVIEII